MKNFKTILGTFCCSALLILFWRSAGEGALGSASNYTPAPAAYKIEFGEKSFWAVHSHITRTDPADNEFAAREQTLRTAKSLGINFVRTGFIWRDIQPAPNRWQWAKFDSVLLSARQQQVHLLGVLHAPPKWAFPAHEHPDAWAVFVDSVVTRYGDYVTDWEIWNEPNINNFWPKTAPIEGFFELVKRAYQTIKQRRPQANVILGAMANQPNAFLFLERLAELGVGNYCDAVGFHPYDVVGEELVPILQRIRGIFSPSGSSPKPIWITEYGWSAWRNPLHPARSQALAQLLRNCLQQELNINRPASILILDDGFAAATEARDLFESLQRQFEDFGWRTELVEAAALLKFFQTNPQPQRDRLVIIPPQRLPAEIMAPVIDFIQHGGTVVALGSNQFLNYTRRLNLNWRSGADEEDMPELSCRLPQNVKLPARIPAKNFLQNPAAPAEVRYVPLVSAYQQGQSLGDVAALYDYHGRNRGAFIAIMPSLTIKANKRSVTYHEQASDLLKTMLVDLLEGGEHFFIYEFRDQETMKDKFYGLVESDFTLKDAARAVAWLQQQLGKGIVVRNKTYFTGGALLELENLDGRRFVVTWGHEAMAQFNKNFMRTTPYAPETYCQLPEKNLLAGLEQQQEGALTNFILWRPAN